jgi:hypothetical protein
MTSCLPIHTASLGATARAYNHRQEPEREIDRTWLNSPNGCALTSSPSGTAKFVSAEKSRPRSREDLPEITANFLGASLSAALDIG